MTGHASLLAVAASKVVLDRWTANDLSETPRGDLLDAVAILQQDEFKACTCDLSRQPCWDAEHVNLRGRGC